MSGTRAGPPRASRGCLTGSIPTATSTRASRSASFAAPPGTSSASKPSCRSRTPIAPRRPARCRSWSRATAKARCTPSRTAAPIAARCFASTSAARRATSSASITTGATTSPATSPASPSAAGSAARAACRPTPSRKRMRRASCGSKRSPAWCSARCRPQTPPLEEYLGPEIVKAIRRVMRAPVKVLGSYSQMLPSNWKLYMENVKDSYHASLLHTFFTTFRLNRLSQKGGLVVSESGGNHISYSMAEDTGGKEYEQAGMRAAQEGFRPRSAGGAGGCRRVRRRHRPADPLGVPELRPAADPQQPRGAPAGAAWVSKRPSWCGPASASRRRCGDDRAPPAPGQPDRSGRLHLDGGRRCARLRAARRQLGGATNCRWWRWAAAASRRTKHVSPKPRCAASGPPTARMMGL